MTSPFIYLNCLFLYLEIDRSMGKCKVFIGIAVVLSCIMFLYGLISGDTEYECGQNLDCPSLYLRRVSRCTVGSTYYCCDEDCWYYKTSAACGDDCCSVLNNTTEYCPHLWWTISKITLIGVGFVLFCFICYFVFSCLANCCCREGAANYTSPSVDTSAENYIKWQRDYNESLASSNKRMFQENSRRMNGSNW